LIVIVNVNLWASQYNSAGFMTVSGFVSLKSVNKVVTVVSDKFFAQMIEKTTCNLLAVVEQSILFVFLRKYV
jgi:hypothetical protein